MHAFMAAVLLRVTWLDPFDLDAEPEPPHRELAQAVESVRASEGNAVVGADGLGQAELLEHGLEHREGVGFLGGGEGLAGEQVSAGQGGDRQRVAIAPTGEHELALVIGAPQLIRLTRSGERGSLRPVASSPAALDQAVAVEHRMYRADRRSVDIGIKPSEAFLDLRGTPA